MIAAFFALAVFARCMSHAPLASCLARCHASDPFQPQQRQTLPGLNNIQLNEYWELRFALPIAGTLLAFVQQQAGTYRV
ncbi:MULTISPECIES: hypothetical protein [Cupriavidus]|uniref:Uncharacterized protein n=1 Tax=Cupriavidus basilensis TaxID=68895 RepID=A0A643FUX8_9BURK|nr:MULTISPECIES: hypothetical protein [Cupriavidus]KUE86392.1 hypothetical protein ASL20_23295 [Cupriavidus necator]NOV23592.1 hypothetical protein [Cupriavidus necator]QOT81666.1 hypothetical protein F7R26_037255 [Cupriavidus basilensis]BDB30123.1 hypothetical protein CTP10_R75400 [Cupriavidus sp. P-10]